MTKTQVPGPPLTQEEATSLLAGHEVIRDPVHTDILITALERMIIDTPAFQRLRYINQLGPCHLVYPGAVHNRFSHSLGTLHCAEQLVQTANRNFEVYNQRDLLRIDPYPHLLVRLCALLHDVAHIPFGHTLEDEGNLLPPEWDDNDRTKFWLGDDSEGSITHVIVEFLRNSGISEAHARQMVEEMRNHLHHKGDPMELRYPFVKDLVGNTLCADLLDYLHRDMLFCGLRGPSGDRVVRYVSIVRLSKTATMGGDEEFLPTDDSEVGTGRVVLLTYRYEREHSADGALKMVPKPEILSEAIDLLRGRFSLAEKVYFHRTKLAASAMLISAAASADLEWKDTYILSDSEFLEALCANPNPRTQRLAEAYRSRRLYRPVYKLGYREERDMDPGSQKLWEQKYKDYRDPEWRKRHEKYLETYSFLPPGSVAIYCPQRGMNLKGFEMLVQGQHGAKIKRLSDILDPNRRLEMSAINQRFEQLWGFQIFVDPDALDVSEFANERVQDLNALCEDVVGFPNDMLELQGKGRPLRDQLASHVIDEWEKAGGAEVPFKVAQEIVRAVHKEEGADLIQSFQKHLKTAMASRPQQGQFRMEEPLE